ncbi:MAG: N-6 DNA methylase [Paludibacter sp.]
MNTETLKSLYQRDNWRVLLHDLFGSNFKAFSKVEDLQVENQTAKSAIQLGEIHLASGDVLAVYEVELQDHIQVERNKVAIRNLLRTHWNKYDGAFIASYKQNENVWRFSFVSETRQYDEEGNYGKVATAAKRFTYVLGQGESIRTATERFNILAATGKNTTLEDIKGAFNVEKMSKDFFDNYKKQYELFCEYMLSKTGIRQAIFNGDDKAIRDFNKKLLGRIVFLYFIQKKGWLGVPLHGEWGDGDTNFLTNLFKKYEHPELFYSSILTVLFFDTLNKKRDNDLVELIKGYNYKIPFLNGGLFEEDNKKHREIIFPKDQFCNLFDFFNQYNFTIYEDDPNDHTVAVDPEMLGHIFENLLEDNKDKGAFYTPKEIVHYMCQESLIEYLCTTLQIEDEAKEREAITKLIKTKEIDDILKPEIQNINKALDRVKICDPAIGSGAFPMGLLHEIFAVKLTLYIFENNTSEGFDAAAVKLNIIQNSIYGVDIEPGAVDIARLRFWLSLIVDEPTPKALPNLDYKIVVGNSLVSKLDDDIINIDWSLNDTSHGLFATDLAKEKAELLEKISHKQKLFFSSDCDKKNLSIDIRNLKIDLLINQLNLMNQKQNIFAKPSPENYLNKPKAKFTEDTAKYLQCLGRKDKIKKLETLKTKADETLHFFDWKLDFPEIMNEQVAEKVGFDIVIGNPPYGAKYSETDKQFFEDNYQTAKSIRGIQKASLDTYTLFIEMSHNSLAINGNLHFIVPISITSSDSMTSVHRLLESDCSIIKVSSFAVRPQPVFENAVVNTSIIFIQKDNIPANKILSTKMYRKSKNFNLQHLVDNLEFIDIKEVKLIGRYPKISLEIEKSILKKLFKEKIKIIDLLSRNGKEIYYRFAGGRYFKVVTDYSTGSSAERAISLNKKFSKSIGAILSSNLYFWFYQIFSDNLNLKAYEIESFSIPIDKLDSDKISLLEKIYSQYLIDIERNANVRQTTRYANIDSFKEYKIGKSKHLIDKIDDIIAPLYGLSDEELNFIKNYEIQFRISDEE